MVWRIKQSFFKTKWEAQLCFGFDDFSFHIGGFDRFLMPFKGFHCNHIVHSGRRFLGKVKSSKFCSSTQSTRWSQLWEVCWISWSRMFNFQRVLKENVICASIYIAIIWFFSMHNTKPINAIAIQHLGFVSVKRITNATLNVTTFWNGEKKHFFDKFILVL